MAENVLYYGDNLEILRRYIKDESIDLVYLAETTPRIRLSRAVDFQIDKFVYDLYNLIPDVEENI